MQMNKTTKLALFYVSIYKAYGFSPQAPVASQSLRQSLTTSALACICINCARVTDCAAYHFVEEKHEQPHMNKNPEFEPQDGSPTIHVNIRTISNEEQRQAEKERMWKEYKDEEEKAEESQKAGVSLEGSEVYNFSPTTTYEYDVVKCADYLEDMGCWVRNMPDEIRKANPDFVPS